MPGDIDFVQHDQSGPILEIPVVGELGLDDIEVRQGIPARFQGWRTENMHQRRAALDAFQELQAQPAAPLAPG